MQQRHKSEYTDKKHSYKRMNNDIARCNCTYYEMVELVCVCLREQNNSRCIR